MDGVIRLSTYKRRKKTENKTTYKKMKLNMRCKEMQCDLLFAILFMSFYYYEAMFLIIVVIVCGFEFYLHM